MADRKPIALVNAYDAGRSSGAPATAEPGAKPARARARRPAAEPGAKPARRGRTRAAKAGTAKPARSRGAQRSGGEASSEPTPADAAAPAADPLIGERKMVNTRVPADLWDALAERAARGGVSLRTAVADALLAAVELSEADHTKRLRGTLMRETEARAAAHDADADVA